MMAPCATAHELDTAADGVQTAPSTTTILIVDDSPLERRFVGNLVEQRLGLPVAYAANGFEALKMLKCGLPAAVLTDLQMPKMDGLELVDHIRVNYPLVPVVLMTAYGSEEIAIQALQAGAASYVPKRSLDRDLAET